MSKVFIKFNKEDSPEFLVEVEKRVNDYFKTNNKSKYGNSSMIFKSVFMLLLYFVPYVLMLTGVASSYWAVMLMWALMGFGICGIGLSIMHDANHGAYSKNVKLNNLMRKSLNLIGGFPANWRIQHNVLHHSFTNIEGYDEDIEKQGIVRFSPTQEHKWIYTFQVFYIPLLYSILTLYWFIGKDYEQLARYKKLGLLPGQGITFKSALPLEILIGKVIYFLAAILLPLLLIDLPWWQILTGFLLMHAISGLSLALIFQSAHVLEETDFYKADENHSVENS